MCHQVEPVASNASHPGVGGCIYVGARSAVTSGVVTSRWNDMQPHMRIRPVTPSSAASSEAKIGSGTIVRTSSSKVPNSHHRCTIRKTSPYQAQPAVFRPTGKSFWLDLIGSHFDPVSAFDDR